MKATMSFAAAQKYINIAVPKRTKSSNPKSKSKRAFLKAFLNSKMGLF